MLLINRYKKVKLWTFPDEMGSNRLCSTSKTLMREQYKNAIKNGNPSQTRGIL
jgi:hypothetical protein